ncbi:hypothetical protein AB0G15_04020 [Streptosporangium sp. NPDC023825]|uniref:hypothetical protein n=1 Tax=Streptosporangium sp. NPDC023825 TaxID=3154909 RepID=UPI0034286368
MVDVNTEALKAATQNLISVLRPIAEQVSTLAEGTHLHPYQWGAIGAATVANNYTPAREYQAKQAADFVKCLDGIHAGLLSVVLHYREAELATAIRVQDAQKMADLPGKIALDRSDLEGATKGKDLGPTD